MSLKAIYEQQKQPEPNTTQSIESANHLLLSKQDEELQKAYLMSQERDSIIQEQHSRIQELEQQVQQLTERNVMLNESDLQLKKSQELNESAENTKKDNEKEQKELNETKSKLDDREKEVKKRENAVNLREDNQDEHDQEVQAKADERIKANKIKAKQAAEDKIADFKRKHWAIFAMICAMCTAQLIGNVIFGVDNRLIADSFQSLYTTVLSNSGYMVLFIVIAILWIWQCFRFFDKFTLLALLIDITVIEYGAQYFVEQGRTLWIVFAGIQGVYIAIRDVASEKSIIREIFDGLTSSKY